ncbi:MAG: GNVR domain-containing protein [Candidatus Omnitrophota bacterium]
MENQEFTKAKKPIDYFKIFFRRKWLLIVPIYVGLVLGVLAGFILPPEYQSRSVIMVEEEKIINPLIQNLAVSTTAAQRMQGIKEILLGWNSLVELSKKLNLVKNSNDQQELEQIVSELRRNIDVGMRQSNVITITYTDKNAYQVQLVAKTLTEILMERNLAAQTKETDVAINFINEQLGVYKRKIKESEIAQMQDELKNLFIDSTEQHPMVRELRHKISIAQKELESGEYEVKGSDKPIAEATRQALQKELDNIINKETKAYSAAAGLSGETGRDADSSMYKLILMDKIGKTVGRDMNVNENIYNMLLQKLETAKITQRLEASKQGTRYTIIESPRMPLSPQKPDKFKLIFLGIVLGGFIGTGLVFIKEFMVHSFLDIEDAKQSLALPVLGGISRITTPEEIVREKARQNYWIMFTLVSSIILIVTTISVSLLIK